jgi:hypothetical protein
MSWVMAMLVTGEAQEAQVEVRAVLASHEFMLWQFWFKVSNKI